MIELIPENFEFEFRGKKYMLKGLAELSDTLLADIYAYNDEIIGDADGMMFPKEGCICNYIEEIFTGRIMEKYGFIQLNDQWLKEEKIDFSPKSFGIIFCSNPLNNKEVELDYLEEYTEASKHFSTALISYEDIINGKLTFHSKKIFPNAIYRGWMLKPAEYKTMYNLLCEKGITLINNYKDYSYYHLYPEWYKNEKKWDGINGNRAVIIDSVIIPKEEITDKTIETAIKNLNGPYTVKDYVKSRKHEWDNACFIPEISDTANAKRIINNFIERQGESFLGGIVLRKYIPFKKIGIHKDSKMPVIEEYRMFFLNNHLISISKYWDNEYSLNYSPEEVKRIAKRCSSRGSHFYSVDIGILETGEWMIIEKGDGQVSDLQGIKPAEFYQKLYHALEAGEADPDEFRHH